MTITAATHSQFMDTIAALVHRGLTFTANADKLTITLTGGF
jgi:hypothetical protein